MPPSGDELILKLLSQSMARLERGDRKRKQKEEEVTFLESVKKVRKDVPEASTNTDIIESLIVYHHLNKVSPHLAEEFSALHTFPRVSNHLKKVSPELAELVEATQQKSHKVLGKGRPVNRKTGITLKMFKPNEDKVINAAIEKAGEGPIDTLALSKELNRKEDSVKSRIATLKRHGGFYKRTAFTLVEDTLLLETLVIPRVGKEKLSEIVLLRRHFLDLTRQLNKSKNGVGERWTNILQPWLLQHYSGTLNLRVERMLANYISDTFTDFSSIDWPEVAARSEFAGHTECSLRRMYFAKLCGNSRSKLGLQSDQMTPQHIADYCDSVYGMEATGLSKARASMTKTKSQRQSEVISFFERRMMDLKLENFA